MTKILGHFKSNVIAYLALFVALGGTSYAAIKIPAGSVGNRQLQNHSVTPIKLARGPIAGYMRAYAEISPLGQIIASSPAAKVLVWQPSGPLAGGTIQWSQPIPSSCFALATAAPPTPGGASASAQLAGTTKGDALTYVFLSAANQGVTVAVMCPQP
jgi:hypothetical protein